MRKRKKINPSTIILVSIIVFFTVILFLSIPVLFNYNSIQNLIEKKIYSEFKINLKILDKISFKILPKPHFLVKKANLNLNIEDINSSIIETENLKLFIPAKNFYSKKNLNFTSLEINNTNIYFKLSDLLDFRKHLYYKINKPIYIKKSKLFLIDKNKNTILISPINKIKYSINSRNNYKELRIKGNIFDVDYQSLWKRYYNNPKNSVNEINFSNPNLFVKNLFNIQGKSNFKGKTSIDFLNENITINYLIDDEKIFINSPKENNNQKIKILSSIELNPFYFNTNIYISEKNINFLIDYFLINIINLNEEYLENINGNLNLLVKDIKNPLINSGKINLSIKEKSVKLENSVFKIKNVGIIKSNFSYYEDKGDLIFLSKNIFEVIDKKEFSRKFQISAKKIENLNQIFFDLEKNIDTGEISISNIHLNEIDNKNFSDKFYIIKNVQLLKSLIRKLIS
tara:strand:+ start:1065 stop:2432 length:1368 start_codon:yes stop_codon:yes gene_type:complete